MIQKLAFEEFDPYIKHEQTSFLYVHTCEHTSCAHIFSCISSTYVEDMHERVREDAILRNDKRCVHHYGLFCQAPCMIRALAKDCYPLCSHIQQKITTVYIKK